MKDYVIFTDSTCDLTPELVKELDIRVMGLYFTYKETIYRDSVEHKDVSPVDFYNYLREGGSSTTSQVNMEDVREALRQPLAEGKDVLYLAFSSGLSGTYQNGVNAAENLREEFPERTIVVYDTLQASMGEGLIVYYAAKLRDQGKTIREIVAYLDENKMRFNAWFTVDDLMFLKRGGRLSGGVAIMGTLLGIKPLLHVDEEGHLINMDKVRGRRASIDALAKRYKEHATDNRVVMISHGDCPEDAKYLEKQLRAAGARKVYISYVGTVIGCHSGPGTLAMFFFGSGR